MRVHARRARGLKMTTAQGKHGADMTPSLDEGGIFVHQELHIRRATPTRFRLMGLSTILMVISLLQTLSYPVHALDPSLPTETSTPGTEESTADVVRPSCRVLVDASAKQSRFLLLQGFEDDADVAVFDSFPAMVPGLGDVTLAEAYQQLRPGFLSIAEYLLSQSKPLLVQPRHCHAHLLVASELQRGLGHARLEALLNDIYQASIEDASFPFMLARDDLRVVESRAKGYYQLLGVNYLDGRITSTLAPGAVELSGVISLHEDTLLIGFDIQERWRRAIRRKQLSRSLNTTDFYIYEQLDFAQDRLHLAIARYVYKHLKTDEEKSKPVPHPCFPKGFSEKLPVVGAVGSPDGVEFVGAGDAKACINVFTEFVHLTNKDCPVGSYCLLNSVSQPKPVSPFFASGKISAVVTFANDVLERQQSKETEDHTVPPLELPLPTLAHVRAAAEHLCSTPTSIFQAWEMEYEGGSKSTTSACFELCQVIVLLKRLGVEETERRVVFGEPVVPNSKAAALDAAKEDVVNKEIKTTHKSNEVAWLVGLFMVLQILEKRQTFSLEADVFAERVGEGLPIGLNMSVLLFAGACFFLYFTTGSRIVKNRYTLLNGTGGSSGSATQASRRTTSSIVFVDDASE